MCNNVTRRGFLMGCSTAIAGLAGSRFNTMAFADPAAPGDILVVVFLRGGVDGLNVVPPVGGVDRGHYEAARPTLQIPTAGVGAAIDLNGQFGLHPSMMPLYELYQDNRLSIVQAVGMLDVVNKSHFDAMQFIELGTPGEKTMTTGWIARHLQTASNIPEGAVMPSLAVGDLQPASLAGDTSTVNLASPDLFNVDNGPWLWRNAQRTALRNLYRTSSSWLHDAGVQAIDAMDIVELNVTGAYTPSNGAVYPEGTFGDNLRVLAQMIKLDLGLSVATVDLGGWDTHEQEGVGSGGYLAGLLSELAQGLHGFYTDLDGASGDNYTQRLTVVVQSEFGRELYENADNGTEHGYGNMMYVLSGNATGGLHGSWPGLAPGQLTDGTDLAVTTDYRQVLSEILTKRLCNPNIETVFPGYTGFTPLGVVQGEAPPSSDIFSDGFESGGVGSWTAGG